MFAGRTSSLPDTRRAYGEDRFINLGRLEGHCVVPVWTPRYDTRRIISMRNAHAEEEIGWRGSLD